MIFADVYANALSSTLLITIIPIFFVFFMPKKGNLNVWLAFAVGGLLGDAFLHLIPHATHDHDPQHESPLSEFLTKYSFILNSDRFCPEGSCTAIKEDDHDHCQDDVCTASEHDHDHHDDHHHDDEHDHEDHHDDGHSHGDHHHDDHSHGDHHDSHSHGDHHDHHSHGDHHHDHDDHGHDISQGLWILAGICSFFFMDKTIRYINPAGHGHSHGEGKNSKRAPENEKELTTESRTTILLNLIADFVHNFTDGLAIGGTWSVSRVAGMTTTIAVLVHEVAHEVGDFAILLQAGMGVRTVVKTQIFTGIGAMIGTVIGVYFGQQNAASWIPSLTAGGFVYIACTSVMPELLEEKSSLCTIFLEMFAMGLGIAFMILITYIE